MVLVSMYCKIYQSCFNVVGFFFHFVTISYCLFIVLRPVRQVFLHVETSATLCFKSITDFDLCMAQSRNSNEFLELPWTRIVLLC